MALEPLREKSLRTCSKSNVSSSGHRVIGAAMILNLIEKSLNISANGRIVAAPRSGNVEDCYLILF
jgi:hypothetical protein